jgi:4-amino-4-deoxy-L-arabinose transferase-like glycosyltransferase
MIQSQVASAPETERQLPDHSKRTGRLRWGLRFIPILLIFLFQLATGWWGIDYGYHWDEKQQFLLVEGTLDTGVLLPGWYKYPSITYWLSLAGLAPHLILAYPQANGDLHALTEHLQKVIWTQAYLLQVRTIFLVISGLTILWVYLQPIAQGRSWLEGLVAAALLGFSWEVAYHSRWLAPDAVLMQFGGLTALLSTLALRRPHRRGWLSVAAIAAGLACGTKYPGGLLLAPVLVAAYSTQAGKPWVKAGRAALLVLPVFLASFLVSTPGSLLEPVKFYKTVTYEIGHYKVGGAEPLVSPGLPHLWLMLNYYFRVLFSHFQPVALPFALLALVGGYALYRDSRPMFVLLVSFPLLYTLYFSLQSVMAVRNLLVVAPFLALFSARGITFTWERLPHQSLRIGWALVIASFLTINAAWLAYAAYTIHARSPELFTRQLMAYVEGHPRVDFAASGRVWTQVEHLSIAPPKNLARLPDPDADMLVFFASEGPQDLKIWPDNWPGLAKRIFGPWEVNFDYYPQWAGEDRILVMPVEKARAIGVQAAP